MTQNERGVGWLKITIDSDPVLHDSITDFLVGILEAGVESRAPDEPDHTTITGYLQQADLNGDQRAQVQSTLENHLRELADIFSVAVPACSLETICQQDWGKKWKEHFKPFAIIPGLVIVPSWEQYEAGPEEQILHMDPGMAFGTGHHATTALSLELISDICRKEPGLTLLDVGTGTGILGMAALLFSASRVLGIDNDADAVSAARENVRKNNLEQRMRVSGQHLGEIEEDFGLVVANIVHDVLLDLSDQLRRLTRPGGHLVLSGILCQDQLESIKNHFTTLGCSCAEQRCRGEWAAVHLTRQQE